MDKYKLELNKGSSKYLQIYNFIKQLIISNEIKEHEKLPPIRKLADYMGVNNATIVKVYELLENEGYVYKIVGSGTFASNMKLKKKKSVKREGLIHFDSGNPSADMFPIEDYKKAINMALERDGSTIFDYDEGKGSK